MIKTVLRLSLPVLLFTVSCAMAATTPPSITSQIRLTSVIRLPEATDAFLPRSRTDQAILEAVRGGQRLNAVSATGSSDPLPCVNTMRIENVPADFGDWQDQGVFQAPQCVRW